MSRHRRKAAPARYEQPRAVVPLSFGIVSVECDLSLAQPLPGRLSVAGRVRLLPQTQRKPLTPRHTRQNVWMHAQTPVERLRSVLTKSCGDRHSQKGES